LPPRLEGDAAAQLVSKLSVLYFQINANPIAVPADDATGNLLWGALNAFVSERSIVSKMPVESTAQIASDLFRYGFSPNEEGSKYRQARRLFEGFAPNLPGQVAAQLAATIDAYVRSNAGLDPKDQQALIPFLSASTAAKAADTIRPHIPEFAFRPSARLGSSTETRFIDMLQAFVLAASKAGAEPMYRTGAMHDLLLIISLPPVFSEVDDVRVAAARALSEISGRGFDLNDIAAIATWARESIGLDPAAIRPLL
jgi:hypothetical protein